MVVDQSIRVVGKVGIILLVGSNIVRQERAPGIVRGVVHIAFGSRWDTRRDNGADVVTLAIVVPGEDLESIIIVT